MCTNHPQIQPRSLRLSHFLFLLPFVFQVVVVPLGAYAQPSFDVIASGLDNPRGLAFSPDGALYVVEAGRGGNIVCATAPSNEYRCLGMSGAITRVAPGEKTRVIENLPSHSIANGMSAGGLQDIAFQGATDAYAIIGSGFNPAQRSDPTQLGPAGNDLGHLIRISTADWTYEKLVDISAYEAAQNPEPSLVDSNPYKFLVQENRFVVVDAGANDVLQVDADGTISTLAVFPKRTIKKTPTMPPFLPDPVPIDSVPTCIALGPDGAYYVGELTGFPFGVGEARIYRIVAGQNPEIYKTGFTNISDLTFDEDGNLYVLEIAHTGLRATPPASGALIRINADGSQDTLIDQGLIRPTAIAIGPDDGMIYISAHGATAGDGEVIRFNPAQASQVKSGWKDYR